MKIGIIGAGAAGLSALRYGIQQNHNCVVFEQTNSIGGTWNYTELTKEDRYGLSIHSSMYQGLMTNLPKELMEYEDFPYKDLNKSYINANEVLNYIKQFAVNYKLLSHIRFLRHVLKVEPQQNDKWKLVEQDLETKRLTEHVFDAIIVCVGHYSVPRLPDIPGMELLGDRAIHSHDYRKTDSYKEKTVLVVGAGPSGSDIATLLTEVTDKVYLSYSGTVYGAPSEAIIHKPLIKKFEGNRAIFQDDSVVEFDNVIFCTGYKYSYPFLMENSGIEVENNSVKYLFKHVINVEHPTMAFLGVVYKVCPFPTFDVQVRFFLEFLKNPKRFTKKEMMMDILQDIKTRGILEHQTHQIGATWQRAYLDNMADTVGVKRIRPVIHKLYEYLPKQRNFRKQYRFIDDEHFIENY